MLGYFESCTHNRSLVGLSTRHVRIKGQNKGSVSAVGVGNSRRVQLGGRVSISRVPSCLPIVTEIWSGAVQLDEKNYVPT